MSRASTRLACTIRNIVHWLSKRKILFNTFFPYNLQRDRDVPARKLISWELFQNKFSHWTIDCVPDRIEREREKKVLKTFWNSVYIVHASTDCRLWIHADKLEERILARLLCILCTLRPRTLRTLGRKRPPLRPPSIIAKSTPRFRASRIRERFPMSSSHRIT